MSYDIRLRERWQRIVVGFLSLWIATGVVVGIATSMTVWSLVLVGSLPVARQ